MTEQKLSQVSYDLISSPMLINSLVKKYSQDEKGCTDRNIQAMADRALMSLHLVSPRSKMNDFGGNSRGQSRTATTLLDSSKTTEEIKCYNDVRRAKEDAYLHRKKRFQGFTVFPRYKRNTVPSIRCNSEPLIAGDGLPSNVGNPISLDTPLLSPQSNEHGKTEDDSDNEGDAEDVEDCNSKGSRSSSRKDCIQVNQVYDDVMNRRCNDFSSINQTPSDCSTDKEGYVSETPTSSGKTYDRIMTERLVHQRICAKSSYTWEKSFPSVRLGDGSVLQNLYPSLSHVRLKNGKIERVDSYIARISGNPQLFEKVVTIRTGEYNQWERTSSPSELTLHRPVSKERMESKSIGPTYDTLRSIHPLATSYKYKVSLPDKVQTHSEDDSCLYDLDSYEINQVSKRTSKAKEDTQSTPPAIQEDKSETLSMSDIEVRSSSNEELSGEKGSTPESSGLECDPRLLTSDTGDDQDGSSVKSSSHVCLVPIENTLPEPEPVIPLQSSSSTIGTTLPVVNVSKSNLRKLDSNRIQGSFCKMSTAKLIVGVPKKTSECPAPNPLGLGYSKIKEKIAKEYAYMQLSKSPTRPSGKINRMQEWTIPAVDMTRDISTNLRYHRDNSYKPYKGTPLDLKFTPDTISSILSTSKSRASSDTKVPQKYLFQNEFG